MATVTFDYKTDDAMPAEAKALDSSVIPLAVDLDGTLLATDLLWESVLLLIKKNFLYIIMLPVWLASGKANLKIQIASRISFDPRHLPYRNHLLSYLQTEHASGRRLLLVTAAAEPLAKTVASHLGIFDEVHATNGQINLSARRKADFLCERFGRHGFDYIGNSRDDIVVFEEARNSIVVAPDAAARRYQKRYETPVFDREKLHLKSYLKMLRVHQWLKNLLIFAPAVLAHRIFDITTFMASLKAFIAFCAAASAIYIVNDLLDLPLDRQHPRKRHRAFASGAFSIPFGLVVSSGLLLVAALICLLLPPVFGLTIALYLVATTAYSFSLKRMLLIDVMCLAGLYSLRLLAGKAAASIQISFWLMAFSLFFFLSLALLKRYVELQSTTAEDGTRIVGRGYRPEDIGIISQSGVASGFIAVLVLALYIQSKEISALYAQPMMIWPIVPVVLYIVMRIWILAHRREVHDDPVVFIATDWRSQIFIGLGGILLFVASAL